MLFEQKKYNNNTGSCRYLHTLHLHSPIFLTCKHHICPLLRLRHCLTTQWLSVIRWGLAFWLEPLILHIVCHVSTFLLISAPVACFPCYCASFKCDEKNFSIPHHTWLFLSMHLRWHPALFCFLLMWNSTYQIGAYYCAVSFLCWTLKLQFRSCALPALCWWRRIILS